MRRGIFIGRFQPPHVGHLKIIEDMSKEVDEVIIGIGSSNEHHATDNPFTSKEREEMLNEALKIANYTIVPIPDIHNYGKWVEHVEKLTPKFEIVYTGNKIVRDLFKKAGYEVKEITSKKYISSTAIRDMMVKDQEWEPYVPKEISELIKKIRGVERVKKFNDTKYKSPSPTVDVVIEVPEGIVLIERQNFPYGWALPGGFVEYGETVEAAAIREAKEETSLDVVLLKLLGVYSDPARDPRRHVISTVFIGKADGIPKASDDAKNVKIFRKEDLPKELAFDHKKILEDFLQWKKNLL